MRTLRLTMVSMLTIALGGCDAIGAIFKVGMWAGILMVVGVALVIGFLASRFR